MTNLFDIRNKVVVMTGACGVLGSAIVKYLGTQGCKLVLLGRNPVKGEALAEEIRSAGGDAMFLVSNVLDESFVTYANEAKVKLLGVKQESIDKYGVVSEQVAAEMASGVANKAKSN